MKHNVLHEKYETDYVQIENSGVRNNTRKPLQAAIMYSTSVRKVKKAIQRGTGAEASARKLDVGRPRSLLVQNNNARPFPVRFQGKERELSYWIMRFLEKRARSEIWNSLCNLVIESI